MADTKKISQPTSGSEDLGRETRDKRDIGRASAGTDTQLHITAKSGKKNKHINDDEKVVRNNASEDNFLTSDETDE